MKTKWEKIVPRFAVEIAFELRPRIKTRPLALPGPEGTVMSAAAVRWVDFRKSHPKGIPYSPLND